MSLLERGDKAYLLLADGTIFEGLHFGVKGTAIGEVVFTTGMTAYQETLTDPSYYGQLVTQTFPLIGNYGVNAADSESAQSYIHGYIVRDGATHRRASVWRATLTVSSMSRTS